jgi:acetoin utilization protein AcuC
VSHFKPDIIISQHGCDAHAYDPLAHVYCSMEIYRRMPMLIKQLADAYCDGRWVALGGGGYDIWRVVPRAWSLLWMTACDHPLLSSLSYESLGTLPEEWLHKWQPIYGRQLPVTWLDDLRQLGKMPRREEITQKNRQTKELARLYLP